MKKDKILFLRLRLLGDIVFTIPAVQVYKEYFPDTEIYYVAEKNFAAIANLIPGIHQVITVPYKMSLKDIFAFRRHIKSLGIKTVIDFHSGPKSALLTRISGATQRIGYQTPNRNWAYTHRTPRQTGSPYSHSVVNQLRLLEHLDIPIKKISPPPYPGLNIDKLKEDVTPGILKLTTTKDKKIVIHIGAGNRFRDWGTDNFAALIKKIKNSSHQPVNIFLVGHTTAEREKGHHLEGLFGAPSKAKESGIFNLTGQLSIAETLFLIAHSSVYFGVDSGPLHLATLTKTPIVAIYGPNVPAVSGPWRQEKVDIIELNMDCRPCSQRSCIYGKIRCMKNISPDKVYEAINKYLQ